MKTSRFAILALAASAASIFSPLGMAQVARQSKESYPNFDVRDPDASAIPQGKGTSSRTNVLARVIESMDEAKVALAARIPSLTVEMNRAGAAPEAIGTESATQFLRRETSAPIAETARVFLVEEAAVYGLSKEQAQALVKFSDYSNPAGNMSWVEYRQEANGIPFFQGEVRLGFTARGALARTTGNLVAGLDYASLPTKAALKPAEAATRAAATIGYTIYASKIAEGAHEEGSRITELGAGPFARPIRTELVYFSPAPGTATLAYSMVLWESIDAYYILVDATDGTLLWRKNITDHQTQAATYSVYTNDSPGPASPSSALPGQNFQAPGISRTAVTLIGNEPPNTFNNLGWITDGGNVTTGNNVNCGLDIVSPNGIDAGGQATGSPTRVFDFAFNPAPNGTDAPSTAASRNGAVTNLFYWTNVYHDRLYLLGFTEAARNFQTNNFARGGSGNDAVLAEVQDYSGTNNANFSTPADGSAGRMQMYLFTGPSPQRDGSLDGDVFIHELTHGTSNRLHNNGSGLATQQSGGMGEGWSDFYARCILSSADEDVNGVFASGGYATYLLSATFTDNYYYGIRRFPYAVKASVGANGQPHNPLTFRTIDFAQINALNNGAFPPSPVIGITANEVHNIGHFWCTALLEMRARIIARLGWEVGNQRALQIVTDAMKLDVSSPTIIQARDSIIAADNAGFAGADVPDIRTAFATRGVGAGATTTGSTTFVIVESFYPSSAAGAVTISDSLGNNNGVAEPGEDLSITIPLTNRLSATDANVAAKLAGYSASYGDIAAGGTVPQTFAYRIPSGTACGTTLQIPFVVTSVNGVANATIPVQAGAPTKTVAFSENFDGVTAPAIPAGWTIANTGVAAGAWKTVTTPIIESANSAFAADVSSSSDSTLTSPAIVLGSNQQLTFKQQFTFETPYDGSVLEIKIGAGAFTDIITAGGSFVQGGYGASITSSAAGNPLIGRRVWSGSVPSPNTVIVNLPPAAAGQSVQFRWRVGCDSSTASTGWFIDGVQVYSTSYACVSIDSDNDGIPDGWETFYGLDPMNGSDAVEDFDGDGTSNLEEYLAGTDPKRAASVFRITSVTHNVMAGAVSLSFATSNGHVYRAESNDDLTNPNGWTLLQDEIVGTGGELQITDATAGALLHRFYRLRLLR